jgi:ATP-dependent protease ClpP protease subunit
MTSDRTASQHSEQLHNLHEYGLSLNSREIYLHSYEGGSGDEPGVDFRMGIKFIKNIDLLNSLSDKPITIKMYTCGGLWDDGIAMFDAIIHSPSKISVIVYAQASSMSSIILQAAPVRVLMPNTHVMVHESSDELDGNVRTINSWAEWNKKTHKLMVNIYARRAQNSDYFRDSTLSTVTKFFNNKFGQRGDWILDAEEAVYYGLADGIYGQKGYESVSSVQRRRSSIPS